MKTAAIAASIVLSFVMPAFAFEGGQPPNGPGPDFALRKAVILKRIDERLTRLQGMRACIQAAHTRDDARACREKFGMKRGPGNRQR